MKITVEVINPIPVKRIAKSLAELELRVSNKKQNKNQENKSA